MKLPIEAAPAEMIEACCIRCRAPMFLIRVLWLDDDGPRQVGELIICRLCDDGG